MIQTLTTTLAQLQTAPSGGGTTGTFGVLIVVAVGLWAVDRWVGLPLGMIPGVGGDASGGLGPLDPAVEFATSMRGVLIGGATLFTLLVFNDALGLPAGTEIQAFVGLILLATYLTLREMDAYSFEMLALVAGSTAVLGLSAMGEPVIGALVNSDLAAIVVVGGMYLTYKLIQAWRAQGTKVVKVDGTVVRRQD